MLRLCDADSQAPNCPGGPRPGAPLDHCKPRPLASSSPARGAAADQPLVLKTLVTKCYEKPDNRCQETGCPLPLPVRELETPPSDYSCGLKPLPHHSRDASFQEESRITQGWLNHR